MKYLTTIIVALTLVFTSAQAQPKQTSGGSPTFKISKEVLKDKIMGGWAGQTIGVTFGGPTEFRFNGTMIQEYRPIAWYDGYIKHTNTGQRIVWQTDDR